MSGVRNVILLSSLLLLFLNPCVPQRSGRENPSELTDRHENVKDNHGAAENTQADIKHGIGEEIGTKEEIVRFGSTVIHFWRPHFPVVLSSSIVLASSSVTSLYFM